MQNFDPYIVIEDTPSRLHLKESNFRQNLHFFLFRILPFILVMPMLLIFAVAGNSTNLSKGMLLLTAICYVVPAILLLTRTYVTEVEIDKAGINLTSKTLSGQKEMYYPIADIANIRSRIRRGKAPGFFYFLNFKIGGKRQRFLTVNRMNMSAAKREFVNQKLRDVTGLDVVNV